MNPKYYYIIVFSILFFCCLQFRAQNYSMEELDSVADLHRGKGEHQKLIDLCLTLAEQYKKSKSTESEINTYIIIANELAHLNRYKESLTYLNKAEKNISIIKNPEIRSKLYGGYGRNYYSLGLYEQANNFFDKSLKYARQISNKKTKTRRLYVGHVWKLTVFAKMGLTDSVKSMERKCMKLDPEPLLYTNIAIRFLKNKQHLDSAEYYLNKAISISGTYPVYQKAMALKNFGKLYTEKKEYGKALQYYFNFLSIVEKSNRKIDRREAYKLISETYKLMHEEDKANEYLVKFSLINDTINEEEKTALKMPIKRIIREKDAHEREEKNKLYIVISIIVLLSVLLFFYLRKAYLKKQKQKDEVITEKLQETHQLKKQINPSFKEVILLAKKGDQRFLARFKEVYHDFYDTLTSRYPTLTTGDIKICALLKLNFTTKEISDIEIISIRTVENKKYRIRKKLELPSEVDLSKWMMEL